MSATVRDRLEQAWNLDNAPRCEVQHFDDECSITAIWACHTHGRTTLWCDTRYQAHLERAARGVLCAVCKALPSAHWTVVPL